MIDCVRPNLPTSLEPLADLELQIARRADELAATRVNRSSLNLVCWLEAEQEILAPILKGFSGKVSGTS
jgi:hypothetical protein